MKKVTAFFLTLVLFTGMALSVSAQAPKADSYDALKKDPKAGIGETLVEVTKKDKDTLFTAQQAEYLRSSAKYLTFAEDNLFQWFQLPDGRYAVMYKPETKNAKGEVIPTPEATIYSVFMAANQKITPGREILVLTIPGFSKAKCKNMGNFLPLAINPDLQPAKILKPGTIIAYFAPVLMVNDAVAEGTASQKLGSMGELFKGLWESTGIYDIIQQSKSNFSSTWILGFGRVLMMAVGLLLCHGVGYPSVQEVFEETGDEEDDLLDA